MNLILDEHSCNDPILEMLVHPSFNSEVLLHSDRDDNEDDGFDQFFFGPPVVAAGSTSSSSSSDENEDLEEEEEEEAFQIRPVPMHVPSSKQQQQQEQLKEEEVAEMNERIRPVLELLSKNLTPVNSKDAAMARFKRIHQKRFVASDSLSFLSQLGAEEVSSVVNKLVSVDSKVVSAFMEQPHLVLGSSPQVKKAVVVKKSKKKLVKKAAVLKHCRPDVVPSSSSSGSSSRSLPQIYTAKQEQVELPSGNDAESKRQRRLIRNRLSAALHRERKREVIDTLQRQVQERDEQIRALQFEAQNAAKEKLDLKEKLRRLEECLGEKEFRSLLNGNSTAADVSSVTTGSEDSEDDSLPSRSSRKRLKGSPTGMLVMAACACIVAALMPVWNQNLHQGPESIHLHVPPSAAPSSWDRRRLSVTTTTAAAASPEFYVSPLESHPDLWNPIEPWTATRRSMDLYQPAPLNSDTEDERSYMFCPDAVTSMSSEFLRLSSLTDDKVLQWSEGIPSITPTHAPTPLMAPVSSENSAPTMKMLLPASSFPASGILGDNKGAEPWIELACEITSAKVMDGVEFIMGS
eukprot:CAMPEP_0116070818 /NCGR_PEP_ID=MMETSP0322-20121206/13311_1 /TAXON_ID=163516 /ORGANISM="Leptocylindrus danicus var. apora, Strain B651" /LENGTH=574 /DNA_ID=CAMNT_0003558849 /DNA_START=62 /DNA_END=1786 /DNA_ORIENTATION=+